MWITAYKTLSQMAELAEQHDVVFAVETLNTKVDHAGYPLSQIEDTVRLVEAVDSPRIRILFDIYHAQVEEGNVIQGLRDHFELIGHIHVADVPRSTRARHGRDQLSQGGVGSEGVGLRRRFGTGSFSIG